MCLYIMFASTEAAIWHINRSKVKSDAEDGIPKAQLLQKRIDPPEVFLAAMQLAIIVTAIGITVASLLLHVPDVLDYAPFPMIIAGGLSAVIILVPATVFSKRFAQLYATKTAYDLIRPMNAFAWLAYPLAKLFSLFVDIFLNVAVTVTRKEDSEDFIEEEIRMMADEASETGAIDVAERKMIHNVFDFNTKTAEEISIHRTHISALEIDSTMQEIAPFVSEEKFTRIPVYEDNLDNILGLLNTKDILEHVLANRPLDDLNLRSILREPHFVPSSKKVDELFVEMRNKQVHMVIVVDEYGGTVGLVTMEDIVEEIMGPILDEHDEQELPDISRLDDTTIIINGITQLRLVAEYFDEINISIDLPTEDYETLGGFLIGQLGRIPEENETPEITYEGLTFRITDTQEKRVLKVMVTILEPTTQPTQET